MNSTFDYEQEIGHLTHVTLWRLRQCMSEALVQEFIAWSLRECISEHLWCKQYAYLQHDVRAWYKQHEPSVAVQDVKTTNSYKTLTIPQFNREVPAPVLGKGSIWGAPRALELLYAETPNLNHISKCLKAIEYGLDEMGWKLCQATLHNLVGGALGTPVAVRRLQVKCPCDGRTLGVSRAITDEAMRAWPNGLLDLVLGLSKDFTAARNRPHEAHLDVMRQMQKKLWDGAWDAISPVNAS